MELCLKIILFGFVEIIWITLSAGGWPPPESPRAKIGGGRQYPLQIPSSSSLIEPSRPDLHPEGSRGQSPRREDWRRRLNRACIQKKVRVSTEPIIQDIEEFQRRYRELPETERASLVQSRIGRGVFRSDLKNYWKTCAVTGCTESKMLVASHIKPWRDSDNFERLDVYNGLLLAPHIDRAFDGGYVSFDDDGKIIISRDLSDEDRKKLGIHPGMRLRKVEKNHRVYLEYHRRNVLMK